MRALLANMGFVLQMSGIFLILPIIVAFAFNETSAVIALFLAATAFFVLGFASNALCERKELTFKQSCTLIVLVFVLLSVIGSIPYIYISISAGEQYVAKVVTDGVFESASGFTTTGFSVINNLSAIPKSILFYRGLTQFIGGIGIVLVLLAFFYPEAKLQEFSRGMGFSKNEKIKKTFLIITSVYCTYTAVMIIAGFVSGYHDIISLSSLIFSAVSTGGFAPFNDITSAATQFPLNFILILSMILGATNFIVLAALFKGKIKEFIKSEISVFLGIAIVSILITTIFFKLSEVDSAFHVISFMSTTGLGYLPQSSYSDGLKLLFIFLMFIGGASFSTAGGIKIYRFILLFKVAKKAVVDEITEQDTPVKLFGKEYSNAEIIQSLGLVVLMAVIILVSSFIVSSYGNYPPIDSIFDVTGAIATTGLSVGVAGPSLVLELKWLFVFLMIIGRVEIIAFFTIFSRKKEPSKTS
jgi:trk system potassium uptake protein TrkH